MEPNEQLVITLPAISEIVAGIEPSQMDGPTACANFTDGDTFAPETVAPGGASPLQRLVAFSGRTI